MPPAALTRARGSVPGNNKDATATAKATPTNTRPRSLSTPIHRLSDGSGRALSPSPPPCQAGWVERPPSAPRRPTNLTRHGDERVDDWYWLRERDNPDVVAYLEAENRWAEQATAHTAGVQETLFGEIKGRIQETDVSAPVGYGPWWYYTRSVEGLQYGVHCRRRRTGRDETAASVLAGTTEEQVLLDENALAEGHEYFALGAIQISPDHRMVAYSTDVEGDQVYTLRVRDLASGDLGDEIPGTYYGVEWSQDNTRLFYTVLHAAKRPWRVYRHRPGHHPANHT